MSDPNQLGWNGPVGGRPNGQQRPYSGQMTD
jgi:hypothetical protein